MTAIAVDLLNPANGDVADGRRVLMLDGSQANIARVGGDFLVVHGGKEFGPFTSTWVVLDVLARIDTELAEKKGSTQDGGDSNAAV